MFVPNISMGIPVIKSIRTCTDMFFDVHLMIEKPERYISRFAEAGADNITVHIEACKDMDKTLEEIKKTGKRAAISLNPDTEIDTLKIKIYNGEIIAKVLETKEVKHG